MVHKWILFDTGLFMGPEQIPEMLEKGSAA